MNSSENLRIYFLPIFQKILVANWSKVSENFKEEGDVVLSQYSEQFTSMNFIGGRSAVVNIFPAYFLSTTE